MKAIMKKPKSTPSTALKVLARKELSVTDLNLGEQAVLSRRLKELRAISRSSDLEKGYQIELYKALLNATLNMAATCEDEVYSSESGKANTKFLYAYNHLVSQARDIVNDLRAIASTGQQAEFIIDIIKQALTTVAQNMVDSTYTLKKKVKTTVKHKEAQIIDIEIDDMLASNAKALRETFKLVEAQINQFLGVK